MTEPKKDHSYLPPKRNLDKMRRFSGWKAADQFEEAALKPPSTPTDSVEKPTALVTIPVTAEQLKSLTSSSATDNIDIKLIPEEKEESVKGTAFKPRLKKMHRGIGDLNYRHLYIPKRPTVDY